jgi:hypothetical protein
MSDVWAALAQLHELLPASDAHRHADIVLRGPGFPETAYDVKAVRSLHPSRIGRYTRQADGPPGDRAQVLVITAAATVTTLDAAQAVGLSVLVAPERGTVVGTLIDTDGRRHTIDASTEPHRDPALRTSQRGRPAWGTFALVHAMLDDPTPRSQTALAHETGLTQARVSQALARLDDLVARRATGWALEHPADAARWLAAHYPPPTTAAGWLTLDEPVPATRAIADALTHADVRYAVTGQVAADLYAPWARPSRTTIWADRLIDLGASGCTPVTEAEASVIIAVPDDPRALTRTREHDGLVLADPWRTWVSLEQSGDDVAADHLRTRLLARRTA